MANMFESIIRGKEILAEAKKPKYQQVYDLLVANDFKLSCDDGECYYVVNRVNTENYKDMPETLIKQLKEDGKYNYYIGIMVTPEMLEDLSYSILPIYGNSNYWVTKWFEYDPIDVIKQDLKPGLGLYDRIDALK